VEPEIAKKDFETILQHEPNNKAAANQIKICNQKIKEQLSKEKQIYANMFEKFAKIDRQVSFE
jgi:FK506-binding protein 4/5